MSERPSESEEKSPSASTIVAAPLRSFDHILTPFESSPNLKTLFSAPVAMEERWCAVVRRLACALRRS